ncbi:MAG TPA: 5'-3' exonuclease H3TH domain-containing protein [Candidatus Absconditabacterales bacterium]|nr:5'-3' exonuclease H3TH domain-containing protein [Candidatus Absconditabacterales bacterium]HNG97168.1 5'-3' exonuclease H3TH domain-containing protein [Candidatus Absconditabacterales bacterium]
MPRIVVLDGMWYLFRAYHAYSLDIATTGGERVNMVFGFFRMIIALATKKPDYLMIARDPPGETLHRFVAFPQYKAQRTQMPEEFGIQVRMCKELCQRLGLISLEYPGYEADDVLYTMAKVPTKVFGTDQISLVLYTGDKDVKQTLSYPNVTIVDPIKDITWTHRLFLSEFGFEPSSMVDYLSLIGDSSDNIPGARGIGPKGATELIKQRGTIEHIYDNLKSMSDRTRELLETSRDDVMRAKELISLYDIPELEVDLTNCFKPDIVLWKQIFVGEFHFRSYEKLLDELKKQWYFSSDGGLF